MKLFMRKTMVLIGFMVFIFSPSCFAESADTGLLQNSSYCHASDAVKLAKHADGLEKVPEEELKRHKSPEGKMNNGEKDRVDHADDTVK